MTRWHTSQAGLTRTLFEVADAERDTRPARPKLATYPIRSVIIRGLPLFAASVGTAETQWVFRSMRQPYATTRKP